MENIKDNKDKNINQSTTNNKNNFNSNSQNSNNNVDNKQAHSNNFVKKDNLNKQNSKKDENINSKVNDLLAKNTSLNNEILNKDQRIKELENQIKQFNENYKNEINKKTIEAQKLVESKIKEQQEKFEKEIQHIKKFALKDKAVELINIINNFDVAVSFTPEDPNVANYVQGFRMFSTMFKNYLANNNIIAIEPSIGDNYDPLTMEAFEAEFNPSFKANQIIKVIKKGYKLHDIVIIPASVVVCKDKKDKN